MEGMLFIQVARNLVFCICFSIQAVKYSWSYVLYIFLKYLFQLNIPDICCLCGMSVTVPVTISESRLDGDCELYPTFIPIIKQPKT